MGALWFLLLLLRGLIFLRVYTLCFSVLLLSVQGVEGCARVLHSSVRRQLRRGYVSESGKVQNARQQREMQMKKKQNVLG